MNKTLVGVIQIASLVSASVYGVAASVGAWAAVETKGQHEGLLLDSHIKYFNDAGGREADTKVILNGESWTLVARTPQGNTLYGRTERVTTGVVAAGAASGRTEGSVAEDTSAPGQVSAGRQPTVDNETIRVLYRELNEAGSEIEASAATAAVGSSTSVELKDAHIDSRVSKIRYQLE